MCKRIELKTLLINNKDSGNYYVLDGNDYFNDEEIELDIDSIDSGYLLISNIQDEKIINLNINNSHITVSLFFEKTLKQFKFNANLRQNSFLNVYAAEFSYGKVSFDSNINLLDEKCSTDWHLASLSSNDDNKNICVSINHLSPRTTATVNNYGVCKDFSKLVFSGDSLIKKGSTGSKTVQNAKTLVFDSHSDAICKPILKIDENDIEASHAAIVGRVNEEHVFYLTSRGLNVNQARTLITFGYLKPILKGFLDEDIKKSISNLIETRL